MGAGRPFHMPAMLRRVAVGSAVALIVAAFGVLGPVDRAVAHPVGQSVVTLDIGTSSVTGSFAIPSTRLDLVLTPPVVDAEEFVDGMVLSSQSSQRLMRYVTPRFAITSPSASTPTSADTVDSPRWAVDWGAPKLSNADGLIDIVMSFTATPPAGSPMSSFDIRVDAITETVRTHDVFVIVASDRNAPGQDTEERLAGVADFDSPIVSVRTSPMPAPAQARRMLTFGNSHFWGGADHVLFILLLAAGLALQFRSDPSAPGEPANASERQPRWRPLVGALFVSSALFSIGHGISLALVALDVMTPPTRLVETAIAVTIIATAGSLTVPKQRRSHVAIVPIFGFIHGFGFGAALNGADVSASNMWLQIASFNIGLELAQLTALVALAPAVALLFRAQGRAVHRYGLTMSAVGIGAGLIWAYERWTNSPNALTRSLERLTSPPAAMLGVVSVAACVALATMAVRRRRADAKSGPGINPRSNERSTTTSSIEPGFATASMLDG